MQHAVKGSDCRQREYLSISSAVGRRCHTEFATIFITVIQENNNCCIAYGVRNNPKIQLVAT